MAVSTELTSEREQHLRSLVTAVYALQALSFIVGLTFVVGAIIDYVKRDEARGSWLESHFHWQIRTFWFTVLWSVLGGLTAFIGIGYFILLAVAIWLIYRIVKGWLRLADGQPV